MSHDAQKDAPLIGMANPVMIDLFAHDRAKDEVLLVMKETRPWDESEERLFQLQEKFNAYASFLLDGELASEHPELAGKRARIELHSTTMPGPRAVELLGMIHDQLALQEIGMEVIVAEGKGCGDSCACQGDD